MDSASKVEQMAKTSRVLGIFSIFIPLVSLMLPVVLNGIANDDFEICSIIINLTSFGGFLFGVPGYVMAAIARRDIDAPADDRLMEIISAGRTMNIIGIVISLLFLCATLNTGFAY